MAEQNIGRKIVHSTQRQKVKSGCKTCKRRKVKCDEQWPACVRCQSTSRTCDGYGVWGGGSRIDLQQKAQANKLVARCKPSSACTIDTSIRRAIPLFSLNSKEVESFEWFMVRSTVKLSGDFPSQHWTKLLLQTSITEPAVRHALLALSSAHREEVQGLGYIGRECKDEQTLFTMAQYDKAIKSLKPWLNGGGSGRKAAHIACIACVLFVSTDFLRGHYANGLVHLKHGINLFLESRAAAAEHDSCEEYIDGWLIMMFTRLLVQAKLTTQFFGFPCENFLRLGFQINHGIFTSVTHARRSLDHIMLRVLHLQEQAYQSVAERPAESATLLDTQNGLQTELHIWLQTCDATVLELPSTSQIWERSAYQLLKLYHHTAIILAGTCLAPWNPLRFDRYNSVFLDIVNMCTKLYNLFFSNGKPNMRVSPDPEPSSPNSIVEMGWIAPLCYTAIRCRNSSIRHQAIRLLRVSPHKEGIWNAELTLAMAVSIVEAEEGARYDSIHNNSLDHDEIELLTDEVLTAPTLPAESRLENFTVSLPEDKVGRLVWSCDRLDSEGVMRRFSQEYDLRTRKWINDPQFKAMNPLPM